MKKVVFSAVLLLCLMVIVAAADFRSIPYMLESRPSKSKCVGYTIIEFDKGIDCHGDTISLVRRNGYAERVRHQTQL
jgi:hypothetical protein